jgi:hypothetical protein
MPQAGAGAASAADERPAIKGERLCAVHKARRCSLRERSGREWAGCGSATFSLSRRSGRLP